MCLRMLCCHPQLLKLSADAFDDPESNAGSAYASQLKEEGELEHLSATPKLDRTLEYMGEIFEADERNKVVLFSFFKPNLQFIGEAARRMTENVSFTGDMNAKQKDAALMEFYDNPKCRLFLSSDAGGAGVDLPNANYLNSFDLPWSAGKMDQRNARIIRLSSEFDNVYLRNILMRGSIEERQYAMLEQKRAIASAVIDGKGIDKKGELVLSLSTLREFLMESEV
jgi:SNF2 family DNA or RNA helicase